MRGMVIIFRRIAEAVLAALVATWAALQYRLSVAIGAFAALLVVFLAIEWRMGWTTKARVLIERPSVDQETITNTESGARHPASYARVDVTNAANRAAGAVAVRAWLTVEGTAISNELLHWRHDTEPGPLQANLDNTPPATLAPQDTRQPDVAIQYPEDGSLYAGSILGYRAGLRHPALRIVQATSILEINVRGDGVRPARARFRLTNHGAGKGLTFTAVPRRSFWRRFSRRPP